MTITAAPTGRLTSAVALLFALCLFGTVATVNVENDPAWWQDTANRGDGLVSAFFAVGAAVLFAVLITWLTRPQEPWFAAARTLGIAATAGLLVVAALRGVIGHLVDHKGQSLPGPDVLSYSTALDHMMLNVPVMSALALTIGAVSIAMLRTIRWVGIVGIACTVAILGAVMFQVGAYAIPAALLWAVCVSVALWRR